MNRSVASRSFVVLGIFIASAAGCSSKPHPAEAPQASEAGSPPRQEPARPAEPAAVTVGGMRLSPQIASIPDPSLPRVMVVELIERNEDSLSGRLTEEDDGHAESPPLDIVDGTLIVRETPAADEDFADASLDVEPIGTPLEKCTLFVIHTIHYAGRGRADAVEAYYAFANSAGAVPRPETLSGDTYEYDPNAAGLPLESAIFAVRVYPDDVAKIELKRDGEQLSVSAGGASPTIAAGEEAELFSAERTVKLREKALLSTSVTESDDLFDTNPPPLPGPAREITKARDYGAVKFSTRLKVINHGLLPLVKQPATATEPKP